MLSEHDVLAWLCRWIPTKRGLRRLLWVWLFPSTVRGAVERAAFRASTSYRPRVRYDELIALIAADFNGLESDQTPTEAQLNDAEDRLLNARIDFLYGR